MQARFPQMATGDLAAVENGRSRLAFARNFFDLKPTFQLLEGHPSNFIYRSLLIGLVFGVSALDIPDTEQLLELISAVDLLAVWKPINRASPRTWVLDELQRAAGLVATDWSGTEYLAWRALIALNLKHGKEFRFPEFTLLQEESTYVSSLEVSIRAHPEESFTVLCYQRGRIPGDHLVYPTVNQYFSDDEHWTLRRVDSFTVLAKDLRTIEVPFSFDGSQPVPKDTLGYESDQVELKPRGMLLLKQLLIDAESSDPIGGKTDQITNLPRISLVAGVFAYATSIDTVHAAAAGNLEVPRNVDLGNVLTTRRRSVSVLVLPFTQLFSGVFRFKVNTRIQRQFSALRVNPQLDLLSFFPKGIPPGSTFKWTKRRLDSAQELPEVTGISYSPSERTEELAGLYEIEFTYNGYTEVLSIQLDYTLVCKRCKLHYKASENSHGICHFHSSHPDEYATAYDNTGFDLGDVIDRLSEMGNDSIIEVFNTYLQDHYAPIASNPHANALAQLLIPGSHVTPHNTLPISWIIEILLRNPVHDREIRELAKIRENIVHLRNWLQDRKYSTQATWNGINAWINKDGSFDLDIFMDLMTLDHFRAIRGNNSYERKWLKERLIGRIGDPGLAVRRFNVETSPDEASAVLDGVRTLNPNIYHGIAQIQRPIRERPLSYVCCRRATTEPPCYVGRHNSETSVPDLSDLMSAGQRGTEWEIDKTTDDSKFLEIRRLYNEGFTTAATQLEAEFNRVHGGLLIPDLGLSEENFQLLKQILREDGGTPDQFRQLVRSASYDQPFRRWIHSREAQLEYGHAPRLPLDVEQIARSKSVFDLFQSLQSVKGRDEAAILKSRDAILQRWLHTDKVPYIAPDLSALELAEFGEIADEFLDEVQKITGTVEQIRTDLINVRKNLDVVEGLPGSVSDKATRKFLRLMWFRGDELRDNLRRVEDGLSNENLKSAITQNRRWLVREYQRAITNDEFRRIIAKATQDLQTNGKIQTGIASFAEIGTLRDVEVRDTLLVATDNQAEQILKAMVNVINNFHQNRLIVEELQAKILTELDRLIPESRDEFEKQLALLGANRAKAFRKNRDLIGGTELARGLYSDLENGVFHLEYVPLEFMAALFREIFDNQAESDQLMIFYTSLDWSLMSRELGEKLLKALKETEGFAAALAKVMLPDSVIERIKQVLGTPVTRLAIAQFLKSRTRFDDPLLVLETEAWTKNEALHAFDQLDDISTERDWNIFLAQPDWRVRYLKEDGSTAELGTLYKLLELHDELLGDLTEAQAAAMEATIAKLTGTDQPDASLLPEDVLNSWVASNAVRQKWFSVVEQTADFIFLSSDNLLESTIASILRQIKLTHPDRVVALQPQLDLAKVELSDLALGLAVWSLRPGNDAAVIWKLLGELYDDNRPMPDFAPYLIDTVSELERQLNAIPSIPWNKARFQPLRRLIRAYRPRLVNEPSNWLRSRAQRWNGAEVSGPLTADQVLELKVRCINFLDLIAESDELTASKAYRHWQSTVASKWRGPPINLDAFTSAFKELADLDQPLPEVFVVTLMSTVLSLLEQTEMQATSPELMRRRWQYLHFGTDEAPLRTDFQQHDRITLGALNDAYLNIRPNLGALDIFSGQLPQITLENQAVSVVAGEIEQFESEALSRIAPGGYDAVVDTLQEQSPHEIPYGAMAGVYPYSPMIYLVMSVMAAKAVAENLQGSLLHGDDVWAASIEDMPKEYRDYYQHVRQAVEEISDGLQPFWASQELRPGLAVLGMSVQNSYSGLSYTDEDGSEVHLFGDPLLLRPIWNNNHEYSRRLKVAYETILSAPLVQEIPVLRKYLGQPDVRIYQWLAAALAKYESGSKSSRPNSVFKQLHLVGIRDEGVTPDALTYFVRAFAFHLPANARLLELNIEEAGPQEVYARRLHYPFARSLVDNLTPTYEFGYVPKKPNPRLFGATYNYRFTPEAWAHYMSTNGVVMLEHRVVDISDRNQDHFGIGHELRKVAADAVSMVKLLTTNPNSEAERTHFPVLIQDPVSRTITGGAVLTRSEYNDDQPRLSADVQNYLEPDASVQSHLVVDFMRGSIGQMASSSYVGTVKGSHSRVSLLLEDSASLRVLSKLREDSRRRCWTAIRTIEVEQLISGANHIISTAVPDYYARTFDIVRRDPIQAFLVNHQSLVTELDRRIEASTLKASAPALADRLKSLYSAEEMRLLLGEFIPNEVYAREELGKYIDTTQLEGPEAVPPRNRPIRQAVMTVLIQAVDESQPEDDLMAKRINIRKAWRSISTTVERMLDEFEVQIAVSAAFAQFDIARHRFSLDSMHSVFKELNLPYLPDAEHAEFAAWRDNLKAESIDTKFFNQGEVVKLQLLLTGNTISIEFQDYISESVSRLAALRFELIDGQLVPASRFSLPRFQPKSVPISSAETSRAVLKLYCVFYFQKWIDKDIVPLGVGADLRGYYQNTLRPRTEQAAARILVWASRSQHWQPADALIYAYVAARDLDAITGRAAEDWLNTTTNFKQNMSDVEYGTLQHRVAQLASPVIELNNEITVQLKKPKKEKNTAKALRRVTSLRILRNFIEVTLVSGPVVNSLNSDLSGFYDMAVHRWLSPLSTESEELEELTIQLQKFLRDPKSVATLEVPIGDTIRTMSTQKQLIKPELDPIAHVLVDLFLIPSLRNIDPRQKTLTHISDQIRSSARTLTVEFRTAMENLTLDNTAFMPLITFPYYVDGGYPAVTRVGAVCDTIARWETLHKVEILSSRWPTLEFDSFRRGWTTDTKPQGEADLQELSMPNPNNSIEISKQILDRDREFVRFSTDPPTYLPMFEGEHATEMEIAFRTNWGENPPFERQSVNATYARYFKNDPRMWFGGIDKYLPEAVTAIARREGLSTKDYIPVPLQGLKGQGLVRALALRPYLGYLRSEPVGRQMLTALVRSQVNATIVPDPVKSLNIPVERSLSGMNKELAEQWRGNRKVNLLPQLIASASSPTSPFGLDLYVIQNTGAVKAGDAEAGKRPLGWALWDNRSGLYTEKLSRAEVVLGSSGTSELLYLITKSRYINSPIKQRGTMLMLRGLVDAEIIDSKEHSVTEPARTLQILEPRIGDDNPETYLDLPRTWYPVDRKLVVFYQRFGFEPAFPYKEVRIDGDLTEATYDPEETGLDDGIMIPKLSRLREFYLIIARHFGVHNYEPLGQFEVNVSPRFREEVSARDERESEDWDALKWTVATKRGDLPRPLLVLPDIDAFLSSEAVSKIKVEQPPAAGDDGGEAPAVVSVDANIARSFQTQYRLMHGVFN